MHAQTPSDNNDISFHVNFIPMKKYLHTSQNERIKIGIL